MTANKYKIRVNKVEQDLRIPLQLTFEETACGFLCGMAPIIEMDHIWKGRIMPETIRQLLQEIIENE